MIDAPRSKSPELIIEEFEARRVREKQGRFTRIFRRGSDLLQIAVLLSLLLMLASGKNAYLITVAPIAICGYLLKELKHRWAIEEELARLKGGDKGPSLL